MTDCIFCKIAAGEIPSDKVFENDEVFAFRDINPQAPVHILVIPRRHIESAAAITRDNSLLAAKCLEAVSSIAEQEGLEKGFRIISNCGEDGGQTVPHLHFHILAGKFLGEKLL